MPLYIYEHPTTGEVKEVFQGMNDTHEYSEGNVKWNRLFLRPQAVTNSISSIDPWSAKQFVDRTRDMKGGTLGDLWDISANLSKQREKKAGKDPIKNKAVTDYEKKTTKPHPLK
jgi:hypothetical protein